MLITSMFPPIQTGSSFYSEDIARILEKRGHKIVVVTLKNNDSVIDNYNFPVHRISAFHFTKLFKRYFKHFKICSLLPKNYILINELAKKNNTDIILLISHYHDISFPAIIVSLFRKIPVVVSINTQMQLINPVTSKIIKFFDRLICGNFILPFCAKIISLDTEIERYVADVYRNNIVKKSVIIPYGFHGDMEFFLDQNHNYELHNQLIGIGSVIEQRNFMKAIIVFKNLLKMFPSLKFKIIGHVYYDAALKMADELGIKDKVIFTGELPHQSVLEEIRNSDIYMGIVSGKYTGLGTATVEAMLMGVPVVANVHSDLFGKNLLFDMENYVYADVNQLEEVAKKIVNLLQNKNLRENIGQGGRMFVKKHLNWNDIAENLENLFKKLISEKQNIMKKT